MSESKGKIIYALVAKRDLYLFLTHIKSGFSRDYEPCTTYYNLRRNHSTTFVPRLILLCFNKESTRSNTLTNVRYAREI